MGATHFRIRVDLRGLAAAPRFLRYFRRWTPTFSVAGDTMSCCSVFSSDNRGSNWSSSQVSFGSSVVAEVGEPSGWIFSGGSISLDCGESLSLLITHLTTSFVLSSVVMVMFSLDDISLSLWCSGAWFSGVFVFTSHESPESPWGLGEIFVSRSLTTFTSAPPFPVDLSPFSFSPPSDGLVGVNSFSILGGLQKAWENLPVPDRLLEKGKLLSSCRTKWDHRHS